MLNLIKRFILWWFPKRDNYVLPYIVTLKKDIIVRDEDQVQDEYPIMPVEDDPEEATEKPYRGW